MTTREDEDDDNPELTWEAYWAFANAFPAIYEAIESFALQRLTRSAGRFSIGAVVERVRWETAITSASEEDGYKINDKWTAFHARRFLQEHPRYADRIETRRSVADRTPRWW